MIIIKNRKKHQLHQQQYLTKKQQAMHRSHIKNLKEIKSAVTSLWHWHRQQGFFYRLCLSGTLVGWAGMCQSWSYDMQDIWTQIHNY